MPGWWRSTISAAQQASGICLRRVPFSSMLTFHVRPKSGLPTVVFCLAICVSAADEPPGAVLYNQHCATCHESGGARIPPPSALRSMSVAAIAKALEVGVMRAQASSLSPPERNTLARWLGRNTAAGVPPENLTNRCSSDPKLAPSAPEWSNWGAGLNNSRFQTADAAGLTAADLPRLKLKWAFAFEGATAMRSQPAVYGNRVFAGGQDGTVVSLDAATGCIYWSTVAPAQVRTGIVVAVVNGTPLVFFGDTTGQLHAVDAMNGKPIWQLRADDHPAAMITATPAYHAGRLYVGVSSFEEVVGRQCRLCLLYVPGQRSCSRCRHGQGHLEDVDGPRTA